MDRLALTSTSVETRASELFEERFQSNARSLDYLLSYLMIGQWAFAIFLSVFFSPYAWVGKTQVIHAHVYLAVFFGALINLLPIALAFLRPGWLLTRMVLAVAQMLWSGLLIHLSGGRIETHFHVFVSLAIIAFYRDWRVLLPATVVVTVDHLLQDGRIVCAGAHEEALIWRAATRTCQRIPVTGTWLAVMKEIGTVTVEVTERLAKGDLLVLYTDGLTEGRNAAGEQFGLERLCEVIEASPESAVTEIRDRVLEVAGQWAANRQDDDVTLLVFRHLGAAQGAAAYGGP